MKEHVNASTLSGLAPLTFWDSVHNQWGDLPAVIEKKAVSLIESTGQRAPGNPGLTGLENINKK